METKIIKSNRKNCELQMRNPDKLIIKVPRKGSEEILEKYKVFISTWVTLKTIGFKNYIKPENLPLNDTELEELYDKAYILFRERLDFYAEIMDTWFTNLQIKNYKSFMECLKAAFKIGYELGKNSKQADKRNDRTNTKSNCPRAKR